MFLVTSKHVARAKLEFSRSDPELFDRGMWQTCRAINEIPSVAVLDSHAGHAEHDDLKFWVTLITSTEEGIAKIDQLYSIWCSMLGTHVKVDEETSFPIHHQLCLEVNRLEDKHGHEGDVIWVHTLRAVIEGHHLPSLTVANRLQLAATRINR